MLIAERAKSKRSKCVNCGREVALGARRLRARLGDGWGYIFCLNCVDIFIRQWHRLNSLKCKHGHDEASHPACFGRREHL
jgi:hypothetical protein